MATVTLSNNILVSLVKRRVASETPLINPFVSALEDIVARWNAEIK